MSEHKAFIGRTPEGERVYVSIRLEEKDGQGHKTTAHEPIEGSYLELAITGETVPKRGRTVNSAGQIVDDLQRLTSEGAWTARDIRSLLTIWRKWHLNGLQAACDHMEMPAIDHRSIDEKLAIVCPLTGYKYGSAWLVRELPAEVIAEIERLMALPVGRIPEYVR